MHINECATHIQQFSQLVGMLNQYNTELLDVIDNPNSVRTRQRLKQALPSQYAMEEIKDITVSTEGLFRIVEVIAQAIEALYRKIKQAVISFYHWFKETILRQKGLKSKIEKDLHYIKTREKVISEKISRIKLNRDKVDFDIFRLTQDNAIPVTSKTAMLIWSDDKKAKTPYSAYSRSMQKYVTVDQNNMITLAALRKYYSQIDPTRVDLGYWEQYAKIGDEADNSGNLCREIYTNMKDFKLVQTPSTEPIKTYRFYTEIGFSEYVVTIGYGACSSKFYRNNPHLEASDMPAETDKTQEACLLSISECESAFKFIDQAVNVLDKNMRGVEELGEFFEKSRLALNESIKRNGQNIDKDAIRMMKTAADLITTFTNLCLISNSGTNDQTITMLEILQASIDYYMTVIALDI